MMVSYAQDAEDVLLQRVFPRDYWGFYIRTWLAERETPTTLAWLAISVTQG